MSSHELLRRGSTFTHRGEPFTVVRVLGGTVVVRDRGGHIRRLWTEQVLEDIATRKAPAASAVESCSDATLQACAALGLTPPRRRTAPTDRERAVAYLHDVDEYAHEVFGERVDRRSVPARPVVHLFTAPETTPPQAA
ncbi:hypothetical protein [Microcella alkaliphila]|uniref:Glutamate 5-kinase n=1 Tax=Microcella alkaliphila TaxID=279828 RepID=A0A0U5B5E3_9MICO|nr:hypothetical protein [Microcella alkaliphila]BAU31076.1 glutamate 5-kinase [Microcella alkaliphila]